MPHGQDKLGALESPLTSQIPPVSAKGGLGPFLAALGEMLLAEGTLKRICDGTDHISDLEQINRSYLCCRQQILLSKLILSLCCSQG